MSLQRRGKYNCSLVFLDDIGPMIQDVHKLVPYDKNLTSILHLRLSHSQGKDGFWKRLKTEIRDDETLKQKKANWKGEKFLKCSQQYKKICLKKVWYQVKAHNFLNFSPQGLVHSGWFLFYYFLKNQIKNV